MQKVVQFKTRGMQRDLSVSAFNSEFAYENKNIRIMPTDENTLLSIVNEKGTKPITIDGIGDSIEGTAIGQAIIDNELIIFTTADSIDRIYKIWHDNIFKGELLYEGSLGFDSKYPIETMVFYENDEIKKVYWTDGKNQPRVINIAAKEDVRNNWNTNSFNFVPTLKLNEEVNIYRNIVANGVFAPGVIQYSFSYFNKYGQESNIFYTSPLFYISYNNRGASPEDKVSNSFDIELKNVDNTFDYIRVYSIHRTSINATPTVKRVVDLAPFLDSEDNKYKVKYTDNGISGDAIDPTELLYLGGEEVVFGTMTQKDNTLFLGDISLKRKEIGNIEIDNSVKTIREWFKNKNVIFKNTRDVVLGEDYKHLDFPEPKGHYPYNNQLKLNSQQFKTFKYLEWYRFGIQAQHYTGKWSEPIWINDVRNETHIETTFYNNSDIVLPVAEYTLNDSSIIEVLKDNGYTRIRPVVVYPTINDREAVCQGILCPTVYNVSDRYGNSPFAQSSWFIRPNVPFDIYKAFHYSQNSETEEWGGDWAELGTFISNPSMYSRAGILSNNRTIVNYNETQFNIDVVNKGAWAEFRHNYPIPGNDKRNAEIQCIWNPPTNPYVSSTSSDSDITEWVSKNAENYYVDQNIVTLHSPDIEFDSEVRSIDTSGLKLRIVGMVPLTAFASDIDIQTSTPVNNFYESEDLPIGFYKEPIGVENNFGYQQIAYPYGSVKGDSHFGFRSLMSGAFWFDELTGYKDDTKNSQQLTTGFVVYPWHRNGSLNNTKFATDNYRSAMLDKKKLSNMKFSYKTQYMDPSNIWNAYVEGDLYKTGISGVAVFDSNEVSLVRIPAPANSNMPDINYYGNVDKLLTVSRIGEKKDGYPIMTTGTQDASKNDNAHLLFTGNYVQVSDDFTNQTTGTDPVRIKYKSTPHAILALNHTTSGGQRILPTIMDVDNPGYGDSWIVNFITGPLGDSILFWDKGKNTNTLFSQDVLTTGIRGNIDNIGGLQYGWLWLGELYNDNVTNRFGGQTDEAFENNLWLPCGEPVSIVDESNNIKNSVTIQWTEGDTYYQRYDHIKTYPFTLEDQNAVTEIVSFMCETRVNIDGRWDRNRGQTSNFAVTPENFNQMNDVYSQPNNFFNYRASNPNKLSLDNFHNSITWTKTKTAGELVDTWTNITLASVLDLDGDKGDVRALRRFNNNIIAFQDKGISQILYNENMQIASTEGVPIEIANSGKVNGKRYLSDSIGCTNKWSICETANGIYFIDDETKGIFLFNGQINNISDKFGFHSWINKSSKSISIWNPVDFNSFISYYDKTNGDVFFISKDECLAFSEPLGQFSSFYSYENTPYFVNIKDMGLWIRDGRLWLHNEGDYNMFFGNYQPFYTTVIANPDMNRDKVFNNIEFRSDSWDERGCLVNTTFDTLEVWNEYQYGTALLDDAPGRPSNLKRKFRIWRANIPRDMNNMRDRIRNPWVYIKLSRNCENTDKTILHDLVVHYFE